MSQFIFIVTNIILPIFLIIGIGFLLHKKFQLHIQTLSKVQIYVLVPALVFYKIYTSSLSNALIFKITLYTIIMFMILLVASTGISKIWKFEKAKEKAFTNAVILRNAGNYGIPLITLLYAGSDGDYAISIHMIALMTSTILMYTIGLYNASSGKYSGKAALKNIKGIPTIYMIGIAGLLRAFSIEVPGPLLSPVVFFYQWCCTSCTYCVRCTTGFCSFCPWRSIGIRCKCNAAYCGTNCSLGALYSYENGPD